MALSARIYDALDVLNVCRHKFEGIFDMHGVRTGSPEDIPGFLGKLHNDRYFAMDFWGLVSSLESMDGRVSDRQIRRTVMDCVCGEWLPNDDPAVTTINKLFDERIRERVASIPLEEAAATKAGPQMAGLQMVEPLLVETEVVRQEIVATVVPKIEMTEGETVSARQERPVVELGNVGTSSVEHIDQVLSRLELINLELKLHLDNIDSRVSRLEPHLEELTTQVVRSLGLAATAETSTRMTIAEESPLSSEEIAPLVIESRWESEEIAPPVIAPVIESRLGSEEIAIPVVEPQWQSQKIPAPVAESLWVSRRVAPPIVAPPVVAPPAVAPRLVSEEIAAPVTESVWANKEMVAEVAPMQVAPVIAAAASPIEAAALSTPPVSEEARVDDDVWPAVDWVGKARGTLRVVGPWLGVAACLWMILWLWGRPRVDVSEAAPVVARSATPAAAPNEAAAKKQPASAIRAQGRAEVASAANSTTPPVDASVRKDAAAAGFANAAGNETAKAPAKAHGAKGDEYVAPPWTKWYDGDAQGGKTVKVAAPAPHSQAK